MSQRKKPFGKIESRGSLINLIVAVNLLYYDCFFDTPKCTRNTSLQNYQRPFNWKGDKIYLFQKSLIM